MSTSLWTVMAYSSEPGAAVHSKRAGAAPTKSRFGVTCSMRCRAIAATSPAGASFARGGVHARHHTARTIPALERNVAMLLRRILVALVIERGQRLHQLGARRARQDHFVDVGAFGGDIRARKSLSELRDFLGAHRRRILRLVDLALVENVDRALGAHHRDLRARPRVIEIGANVLA